MAGGCIAFCGNTPPPAIRRGTPLEGRLSSPPSKGNAKRCCVGEREAELTRWSFHILTPVTTVPKERGRGMSDGLGGPQTGDSNLLL